MKRWKEKWNSLSASEKAELLIRLCCAIGIVVLSLLQVLGVWSRAAFVYEPLLGVLMLVEAHRYWKRGEKDHALFSLLGAVILAVVWLIVGFLKQGS